jgi:hypothetical protein
VPAKAYPASAHAPERRSSTNRCGCMGRTLTSTRDAGHEGSLDRRNVECRHVQSPMPTGLGNTANLRPSGGQLDGDVESVGGVQIDTLERAGQVRNLVATIASITYIGTSTDLAVCEQVSTVLCLQV